MTPINCQGDVELFRAIAKAVFYELAEKQKSQTASGASNNNNNTINTGNNGCCHEDKDDYSTNFAIDRVNELITITLKGGTKLSISLMDLASAITKYLPLDHGGHQPSVPVVPCPREATLSNIRFDINSNNPVMIKEYCSGLTENESIQWLWNIGGSPVDYSVRFTLEDATLKLELVNRQTNIPVSEADVDLRSLINDIVEEKLRNHHVHTDGITIVGTGTASNPLRAVNSGGGSGLGGGSSGNRFLITDFVDEDNKLKIKVLENGSPREHAVDKPKVVRDVSHVGANLRIDFTDNSNITIDNLSPIRDALASEEPETTTGTDLPTQLIGRSRNRLLADPEQWATITINGQDYLIPLYEKN